MRTLEMAVPGEVGVHMARWSKRDGPRWWSRLRVRIGTSYVVVTLLIALLLEAIVLSAAFLFVSYSPFLGWVNMERVDHAAQLYALQASLEGGGTQLNPDTTFEPDQDASLALSSGSDTPQLSAFRLSVPYVAPGSAAPDILGTAVLVDTAGRVVASSYPDRYPDSADIAEVLPEEQALIRGALNGETDARMKNTPQGMHVAVARTVWSRDEQPLGAIYVEAPAGLPRDPNIVADVLGILIPSSVVWLCLMLPIGLLFGVLTTRGMTRRIERLAAATARFTDGDFSQRVPVKSSDEIGQMERQFNTMAEQLVDSFEQRQALAEQSARREERARIEQEMLSAHYVQLSLLPEEVPALPGWDIKPYYRPARQVGGDLYDFLSLPGGRIGIVIGDVSGKGMPAALIMATTCAMIRAAAPGRESPGEVLALVNNLLQSYIADSTTFATCFYGILDPASGRLRFANAGHDLPYLSRNGDIVELRATGMPLGLMPDQDYPEQEVRIYDDDLVLFYTDGVVETHNAERDMFGRPRLQELLKADGHEDHIVEYLLDRLETFAGDTWEQEDDITVVAVRRGDWDGRSGRSQPVPALVGERGPDG